MKGITVNATRDQLDRFKESILWADIVRELEDWKTGFTLEMQSIVDQSADSNPSTASVLMHLGDINGRIKAVDYMLSIVDIFSDILEAQKEEENARRE